MIIRTLLPTALLAFATVTAGKAVAAQTNQVHYGRGIVRAIATDLSKTVIRHEAITNYMPAMTMEFRVRDTNELLGVEVGNTVTFRLTTTEKSHWIDQIRPVRAATNGTPAIPPWTNLRSGSELKPGDPLPDYDLVAENGRSVRFSSFRGKVLAFTFIFTRCPLPDFCPRMGRQFAQTRELLLAMTNAPANWQLLSISFDPEFDKPEVLANYASAYRGSNADRWLFAAAPLPVLAELAPRLDLMLARDPGGSISHNLRTVVVDAQGRIYYQFDGNQWTPEQLAQEILGAAAAQKLTPGPK